MAGKYKVLITDGRFPHYEFEKDILSKIGAEVVLAGQPYGKHDEGFLISRAKDADALIVAQAKITSRVIHSLEKCKIIVRYGIGIDTIDIEAATKKGMMVANVNDHCIDEVADHALSLIMCLARKTVLSARKVKQGDWGVAGLRPIHRLSTQTIGLIGCGRIGRNLAKKARGIGFKIIGYDPYLPAEAAAKSGIELCALERVMKEADIISLHLPLMDSTKNMINRETIEMMKPEAVLVNVSRGGLVDEQALIEALENKRIAGAGLDVVCKEPIDINNYLLRMDNVIVTAHTAWYSNESNEDLQKKAAQIVADALTGKEIKTLINGKELNR